MRLVSFRYGGVVRLGALLGAELLDLAGTAALLRGGAGEQRSRLQAVVRMGADATAFLRAGPGAWDAVRAVADLAVGADPAWLHHRGVLLPRERCRLLPPVPAPPKILCVARNYPDHAAEVGAARPAVPVLFARYPQTLVGPDDPVWYPRVSGQLDWEGEVAVIIGRPGRHVSPADAGRLIAGYALLNDLSVRDYQLRVPQFTAGKNFDASAPFGPALVTVDEIKDPGDMDLLVTLDGETVQAGNTGEMLFGVAELIAHISEWSTLLPGDVIATGTPAGIGHARSPARYLRPGETIRVASPDLGELVNTVVEEPEPQWIEDHHDHV
jgi:2-keto-4-pentenoate hydratase/2-oxohepta-3-ene-1,7-dioic acid hydratase in catechol pathway